MVEQWTYEIWDGDGCGIEFSRDAEGDGLVAIHALALEGPEDDETTTRNFTGIFDGKQLARALRRVADLMEGE